MKPNCFLLIAIVGLLGTAPVVAQENGKSLAVTTADQIPGAARITRGRPAELSFKKQTEFTIPQSKMK